MKKLILLPFMAVALGATGATPSDDQPLKGGDFQPSWESLAAWECPDWFKDAKFGIWAHWGPQCEAEDGDWYARFMYYPGSGQYNWHTSHYGNPAVFGLKDLCNEWKAENWNPKELIELYKSVGARYFMTLANHHDNFDLWDSPYQEWNSVNIGPKRDIVGEWSAACKEAGLPLGVSVHASHAWSWLEPSQKYDGNLTREDGYKLNADGSEKWWKGYDPQELYAQNHPHSSGWENSGTIHSQWDWGNGVCLPDEAYKKKLLNRTLQLVYDYNPDMVYFDDTATPFYGCDEQWGLDFLSSYYNHSAGLHAGRQQVVVTGKQLVPHIKDAMMWDVERGIPDRMQSEYWQTCTCIGEWHYNQSTYKNNTYKSAPTVVRMLIDAVSKNGNLLLSVPVKGDGTIDDKERAILAGIKAWMDINSESIYGTRTWKTFGEGPLAEADNPMSAQGFNEGQNYSSDDVRFVQKDGVIYATILAWPAGTDYVIKSFSKLADTYSGNVTSVKLLGHGPVEFNHATEGLRVTLPTAHPNEIAPVLAITVDNTSITPAERLAALIEVVESFVAGINGNSSEIDTGRYNTSACRRLDEALRAAKDKEGATSEADIAAVYTELDRAYNELVKNGKNRGGINTDMSQYRADMTIDKLVERSNFKRSEGTGRFGRPANWTVENFKIPNGSDGIKQGIDRFPGVETLMLGVWNDRAANQEGNLANARIYRKITLPRGIYYFGATYQTTYNISPKAYMFLSDKLSATVDLPSEAKAFYPVTDCKESTTDFSGLWFAVEEEKEFYIGWQADLREGSDTQEFRVLKVALLQLADCDREGIRSFITDITAYIDSISRCGKIGPNTGQFPADAFTTMKEFAETAAADLDTTPENELITLYIVLNRQWETFLAARHRGCIEDSGFGSDLTASLLVESEDFTPVEETGKRFAAPLHWTVENFSVASGNDGVKKGLDKYTGHFSLMLGVWDDRSNNSDGSLTDARIYRRVNLDKGEYYFGARYNALHAMNHTFMFCNSDVLPTSEVMDKALAWCDINDARIDDVFHGLHFTVTEPGEYCIGWQADLLNGPVQQEFRADKVILMKKDGAGIDEIISDDPDTLFDPSLPYDIYNLQGQRVNHPTPGTIYIIHQNGHALKIRY